MPSTNSDPRVYLSIGLAAHRDLLPEQEPALREAVRHLFTQLRAAYPVLPLRLISALAESGDQLVAEEALAMGVELVVPLPMPLAEYERDFEHPEALARFRSLLAHAPRYRVLPLAPGNTAEAISQRGEARNLQYAQLGMFVSSHCQLLLALWDGQPSSATGGTAQVVEFHINNLMPSLAIEQIAPNLLADDESDLVYHIRCSRRLAPTSTHASMPVQTRWITQAGAVPSDQGMPEHYRHVFNQMETFNLDLTRYRVEIDATSPQLFDATVPEPPSPVVARIEQQFHAADWLAIHFRHRVRLSLLSTHAIAALMGLSFILFSDLDDSRWYVVAYIGFFLVGLALNRLGAGREWQRKYLDYRGLAEGLRVQVYWRLAGVDIPPNSSLGYDSFLQKQDTDLSWIRHAMRGTGLLRDDDLHNEQEWLDWVIRHWVGDAQGAGGQLAYFQHSTRLRERAFQWTTRLGDAALFGGLASATLLLLVGHRTSPGFEMSLILIMGLLPLLAGIREAYSYKKADKELIKQFRFMIHLFQSCSVRLHQARDNNQKRQLLLALGRACLEEHSEWILLHRERPLEQPQMV